MANSQNGWHTLHCFTRENIAVQEGSTWYDKYRTLVKNQKVCTSNRRDRVAIHEYRGDGVSIQIAHGLLRFLGAKRDKDNSCSRNGWYLMKIPQSEKTHNPGFWGQSWYLSDCTVKDMCNYVNGLSPNCMRVRGNLVNETIWHAWEETPLPGDILSIDEQCKVRWGNSSVQCDPTGQGNFYPEDMCGDHHIYCTSDQYTGCVCRIRVASGTPCGHARVCRKGQCVFNTDVPLGENCECHSQCISNAVCDPDTLVCVCNECYYNNSGNCTEKIPNGGECSEDVECKDPNALCINGTCQCKPCYYNNNGVCVKQSNIGEQCNSTAQCKGDRTACDTESNVCVCETGYFIDDEANCVPVNGTICDRCIQQPDSCTQDGTTCSDRGFCECSNNTVEFNGECYGTRVGESCTTEVDTCTDYYAECNGTVCDCVEGFSWNGTICVGRTLCDPCDTSPSSCDDELVCSPETYRCECPSGHVQVGDTCYGRFVTEPCTISLDTCVDDNAECNGTVCVCIANFVWNGSICVGDSLCDPCDPAITTCDSSLVCSSDTYRCECPPGFVQIGDACYGTRVGQECTNTVNTCIDDYAECNGTVCTCINGYNWNGSICGGPNLCDQCDPNTPSCGANLVCSDTTYRCECPADEVQIADMCYGTHVGDSCTTSLNTCIDDNAGCNGTICDCLPGFTFNGTICSGPDLCDPCDPSSNACSGSLVCSSTTFRCECPSGEVQIGNNCYGTNIGDSCTSSLSTCIDDNAECNGTVCTCIENYVWNGTFC
ncbi:neurogenic locus notch homolog protein 1-like, partial [Ruditapes philippinarum]|uniref:neurogenic locus notch homolog protein 1-like n=1 Tax=Ruditapes philippinarum TaxID=129788 RepID=UPI00295BA8FA